jgi:hypothetical protein
MSAVDPQHRIQVDVARDRLAHRVADSDGARVVRSGGISGCNVAIGGGLRSRIAAIILARLPPSNALRPVSIS